MFGVCLLQSTVGRNYGLCEMYRPLAVAFSRGLGIDEFSLAVVIRFMLGALGVR
jgi:hypothetical protein